MIIKDIFTLLSDEKFGYEVEKLQWRLSMEEATLFREDVDYLINNISTFNEFRLLKLCELLSVICRKREYFDECCSIFGWFLQEDNLNLKLAAIKAIRGI